MFGAIPKYNLADVIYHGKQITEIISEGPMGIGFVSGGTGVTGLGNLTDEQISYLLHCFGELDQMADVILVDTGAGIANHVLEFVLASLLLGAFSPLSAGGSCGHNTGADITDRFLFSVKVSVPESEV